jgi:hypothetical protein
MVDQIEDIFCFYWLEPGGLCKYVWYNQSVSRDEFENRDALLTGFLSALMSFSQEMFGDDMASIDIKNKLIGFERLSNNDILALVTTMDFDSHYTKQILSELAKKLSTMEFPEPTGETSQFNFIENIVVEIIQNTLPHSVEEILTPLLEKHLETFNLHGYLICNDTLEINRKKVQSDLDFELETFLNSVFWEKLVSIDRECAILSQKFFNFGPVEWMVIRTPLNTLLNVLTPQGFISESFDLNTKFDSISKSIQEILFIIKSDNKEITPPRQLESCSGQSTESAGVFEELKEYCGILGFYVFNPAQKVPVTNYLPEGIAEKDVKDFLSTYIKKQQLGMDIAKDYVIFQHETQTFVISFHNNNYLICIAGRTVDIDMICDKIKETWIRFDVGL